MTEENLEEPVSPAENEMEESAPAPVEPVVAETAPPPVEPVAAETARPESKFRAWLRKAGRTTIRMLLLFAAGFLVAYLVLYRPKVAQLETDLVQRNVDALNMETRIAELEAELDSLSGLRNENALLSDRANYLESRMMVLSALADVHAAQFALAVGDVTNARLQLANTRNSLDVLDDLMGDDRDAALEGMRQRLELAFAGMESDGFAAQSDLEVLANSLINLENDLIGGQ